MEASVKLTRDKATGLPDGYVASVRNISRRKEAESRLEHIATHDPLTELPNRTLFRQRLGQELSRSARTGKRFGLLCLDLDGFKRVNDDIGHYAGDVVLREAASRFRSVVRAEDTVARIGGDEFVVLQITDSDLPASAQRLADRLIGVMIEPVDVEGTPVRVSVSVGIAVAEPGRSNPETLFRAADQALYKAKKAGKNTHRLFDEAGQRQDI